MANITIPPEALEAGAIELAGLRAQNKDEFDKLSEPIKNHIRAEARAAFLTMLEAWPGMHIHEWQRPWLGGMSGTDLILPLTEASDEPV